MATIEPAIREEKLSTPEEIANRLRMSPAWVYRTFRHYTGVLAFSKAKPGKRPYVTLRIPESVLQRWIREHSAETPGKKPLCVLTNGDK